jgi:predicted RNA-binding Zn ribbon-like protein
VSTPPPAPGEDRSPSLALANTLLVSRAQAVDLLADAGAATGWLAAHGLPTAGASVADVAALGALRQAVRALFDARVHGTPPDEGTVETVNGAAARLPPPTLTWAADGPRARPAPAGFDVVLARLAADAIDLVAGDRGVALRRCPARGCVRFFLQDHSRRRWCSRACGDRVRVARHYERRRTAGT